jgi:hypothetical protein
VVGSHGSLLVVLGVGFYILIVFIVISYLIVL